jgi:hypothetical protein
MTQAIAQAPVSEQPNVTTLVQPAFPASEPVSNSPDAATETASTAKAPAATSPAVTELAHASPAEATASTAPITAQEIILPPATLQPDGDKPVLVMYQGPEGKNRIVITGDGHGKWKLPNWNQVEGLPKEGVQLTFGEGKLTVANLGQRAEKPSLTIKDHAMFSWMPMDLAKLILGDQFHALVPSEIQPSLINLPKVETRPAETALTQDAANNPAAVATLPAAVNAQTVSGTDSASSKPVPTNAVSAITHDGAQLPTNAMLAMHGTKSTQLGAMM